MTSRNTPYTNISIDDRNTTFLTYFGRWDKEGTFQAVDYKGENISGTLSSTSDITAGVTLVSHSQCKTPIANSILSVIQNCPLPFRAVYYYGVTQYAICADCASTNLEPVNPVNATVGGSPPPVSEVLNTRKFVKDNILIVTLNV